MVRAKLHYHSIVGRSIEQYHDDLHHYNYRHQEWLGPMRPSMFVLLEMTCATSGRKATKSLQIPGNLKGRLTVILWSGMSKSVMRVFTVAAFGVEIERK